MTMQVDLYSDATATASDKIEQFFPIFAPKWDALIEAAEKREGECAANYARRQAIRDELNDLAVKIGIALRDKQDGRAVDEAALERMQTKQAKLKAKLAELEPSGNVEKLSPDELRWKEA